MCVGMSAHKVNVFKVLVLTDSRGRSLQENISEKIATSGLNIAVKVIYKPGITLEQCVENALSWGNDPTDQQDLIVIQAGICDFTERNRQGRIKILNYIRKGQVEAVEKLLEKLGHNLGSKALVATIIPASLKKYLKFHQEEYHIPDDITETVSAQQEDLIKDIQHINHKITEFNKEHNNRTIDLHDRVFSSTLKRRKNKSKIKRSLIFKDSQLYDGVHPEETLSDFLHKRTWYVIKYTAMQSSSNESGLFSSQESQSEAETWDFKRPRI